MHFSFRSLLLLLPFVFQACQNRQADDTAHLEGHLPANLVEHPSDKPSANASMPSLGCLAFTDTIHDFGRMVEGEEVTYDFEFVNQGQKDILISEAKASCGCTVAVWPEHPVRHGEHDKIKVSFNSQGKQGMNEKAVVVRTNGSPSVYTLYIRAEVRGQE